MTKNITYLQHSLNEKSENESFETMTRSDRGIVRICRLIPNSPFGLVTVSTEHSEMRSSREPCFKFEGLESFISMDGPCFHHVNYELVTS